MGNVTVKQSSRLADLINYRLRVISQDGRVYIGELMAFDKHMNVVLKDCVEERVPKTQIDKLRKDLMDQGVKVEKRILGLTIIRGEQILSTVVEDKPSTSKKERLAGVERQQKQVQKQKRQRSKGTNPHSKSNGKGVTKPAGRYGAPPNHLPSDTAQQKRKFQPPPGFKKRQEPTR